LREAVTDVWWPLLAGAIAGRIALAGDSARA